MMPAGGKSAVQRYQQRRGIQAFGSRSNRRGTAQRRIDPLASRITAVGQHLEFLARRGEAGGSGQRGEGRTALVTAADLHTPSR